MVSPTKAPVRNPFQAPLVSTLDGSATSPVLRYGKVTVSVETITPEIAAKWLDEHNTHNRNIQPERVSGHARDMESSNWWFVGDTIRFATADDRDILIDGQHRLAAIVRSELSQVYIVVRGLDLEAQEAIDTNKIRSFSNTLQLERDANGERVWGDENNVAAVTRRLLLWEKNVVTSLGRQGGSNTNLNPTKAEQRTYLRSHEGEIREAMKVVKAAKASGQPLNTSPSSIASAWVLLARRDHNGADLFVVEQLINGLRIDDPNTPQAALRRRLSRFDVYRPTHGEGFLLILKAWNHWKRGEAVEKLQAPRSGWPKPDDFGIL